MLPIVSYPLHASQPPPVYVFDPEHPPAGVLRLGASPGYNNTSEWRVYRAGCRYKEWPNGIQRRIAVGQLVYARSMVPVGPDDTSYVILYGEVTEVKRIMKNWVVFTVRTWSGVERELQVPARMAKLTGIWLTRQNLGDVEPDTISDHPTPHTPRSEGTPPLSFPAPQPTPLLYTVRSTLRQVFACF
ncbi:hypothetical protein BV25DRAFT_1917691 [Artomyces pyxidatus]|uniref:Uncharacterized protein n=1 Tax=Artomyces pyxidatus TaxID=48021 RepID=A0ACB8SVY7_9AGAM|nr:hypothetical protein BV25DRAFT_1917691 [Artomyces pyxidatus]